MRAFRHALLMFATLAVIVAACGGGGGGTSSGAPAVTPAAGASLAAAADQSQEPAAAASTATTESTPGTEPPGGGGGTAAGDVCALVTGDQLTSIFGVPVATQVFLGPPDTCDVQSTDGAPLAAFVLTPGMGGVSASFVFDAFAGSPTATPISGIGEKAAYDPNQGALLVLKNGAVLSIAVFDDGSGSTDEATRLDQMKLIGAAAASRM